MQNASEMVTKQETKRKREMMEPNLLSGEYQDLPGEGSCTQCPSRMYCDPYESGNATGIIVPLTCPSGHYCPTGTGDKYTNPCPAGTYGRDSLESQGEFSVLCGIVLKVGRFVLYLNILYTVHVFW